MSTDQFIPYAHQSIDDSDVQAVTAALSGSSITRSANVEAFEQAIASYCGAEYAVAFNSGSSALLATGYAAELGPCDQVITTPNTFVASVATGMSRQVNPVFVDIDLETGNLDLNQVEYTLQANPPSTRGRTVILPVHFAGIPVDMQRLDRMIHTPKAVVIEDAAHALGSHYPDGQRVGCCAWSQMTVFSFHPAKTITTGEGGMVTTNDPDLYRRLCLFRNNGIEKDPTYWQTDPSACYEGYYEVVDLTCNYNFTEFQAALGLSQLKRLGEFIDKRRELMAYYRHLLHEVSNIRMFTAIHDPLVAFHLCVVQIDFAYYNTTRAHVMTQLKKRGIGTQVHYIPVYRHPFFTKYNHDIDISPYFPNMEIYYSQALSLPLYYDLSKEDIEYIVCTLKDILVEEFQKKRPSNKRENKRPYARKR